MKTYKTVRIDYDKEVVDTMTCDLCGKRQTDDRYRENDWTQSEYDFEITTIKMEKGTAYPDNGHSNKVVFDVCPECFEQVLMPFLESHGAKPTHIELDW